jgi:hypothetical protein
MSWQAIRLDRALTGDEIRQGLSTVLGVEADSVAVGERLDALDPTSPVMAAHRTDAGDFPGAIDVVTQEDLELGNDALRALCAHWACRGLIPDDESDDAYRYLLFTANDGPTPVWVARDELDEHEALVIERPANESDAHSVPPAVVSRQRETSTPPESAGGG